MNPKHGHFKGFGAHEVPEIALTHDELVAMGYEDASDVTDDYDFLTQTFYPPDNGDPTTSYPSSGTSAAGETTYIDASGNELPASLVFVRQGKTLPFIVGGNTDESVEAATGIIGLVSEIQRKMGIAITGKISDTDIRTYQKAKFGDDDGVIGKDTYTALGFSAPFPKSASGGSTYNPSTDKEQLIKVPITDQFWFYPAVGVGSLALLVVVLRTLKKNKKKKKTQVRMNRY